MIDFSLLLLPTPKTISAYWRVTSSFHHMSSRSAKRRERFEQWFTVAMLKGSLPAPADILPLWPEICIGRRYQIVRRFERVAGELVIGIIDRQRKMADDVDEETDRRTERAFCRRAPRCYATAERDG